MSNPAAVRSPPWLIPGLSRGALSGLLSALLLGIWEGFVVGGRTEALDALGLAVLGVYAAGVIALLLVPWGMVVGAGLSAWAAPVGSISRWLNALATDEARDIQATQGLLRVASVLGCFVGVCAVVLPELVLTASTLLLVVPACLCVAVILAASVSRVLGAVVAWLPLESLGRPHMTKVQGLLYVLVLLGVGLWTPPLLGLLDQMDDPALAVSVLIAGVGPVLLHGLLRRADESRTGHPLCMLVAWLALAVLSFRPISSFQQQEKIRNASYAHTALERHVLLWLGQHLGDKDGDGLPGLFGGGDCDDQDPSRRLICDE